MRLRHAYEDREVELSLWIIERFSGTPGAVEGQELKWVPADALAAQDMLEADRPFIEALTRPPASV
jgi:8-oxo-dGTP diphosphatase